MCRRGRRHVVILSCPPLVVVTFGPWSNSLRFKSQQTDTTSITVCVTDFIMTQQIKLHPPVCVLFLCKHLHPPRSWDVVQVVFAQTYVETKVPPDTTVPVTRRVWETGHDSEMSVIGKPVYTLGPPVKGSWE